jgi:hypothetical protein
MSLDHLGERGLVRALGESAEEFAVCSRSDIYNRVRADFKFS